MVRLGAAVLTWFPLKPFIPFCIRHSSMLLKVEILRF